MPNQGSALCRASKSFIFDTGIANYSGGDGGHTVPGTACHSAVMTYCRYVTDISIPCTVLRTLCGAVGYQCSRSRGARRAGWAAASAAVSLDISRGSGWLTLGPEWNHLRPRQLPRVLPGGHHRPDEASRRPVSHAGPNQLGAHVLDRSSPLGAARDGG